MDQKARVAFYERLAQFEGSCLIISHDRTLLNQMKTTLELTPKGIKTYGGNYDFYVAEKTAEQERLQLHLDATEREQKNLVKTKEKQDQKASKGKTYGERMVKIGKWDKLTAFGKKHQAQMTKAKKDEELHQKKDALMETKQSLEEKQEIIQQLKLDFDKTALPRTKQILEIKDLCFGYDRPLLKRFNLTIS
ncbi:hypothetical protein OAN22_01490 [Alphaproteobacteria bacterium]|nr:hypothetical protein [Alphaproteobacteria bacterium]